MKNPLEIFNFDFIEVIEEDVPDLSMNFVIETDELKIEVSYIEDME